HDCAVSVAVGAHVYRREPEFGRLRVGDIVHAVAVDAGWHIGVAIEQASAVDAADVLFINLAVTRGAGLRDLLALGGAHAAVWLGNRSLGVRVVAVGAHRRVFVACQEDLVMNAVEGLIILLVVAFSAGVAI